MIGKVVTWALIGDGKIHSRSQLHVKLTLIGRALAWVFCFLYFAFAIANIVFGAIYLSEAEYADFGIFIGAILIIGMFFYWITTPRWRTWPFSCRGDIV